MTSINEELAKQLDNYVSCAANLSKAQCEVMARAVVQLRKDDSVHTHNAKVIGSYMNDNVKLNRELNDLRREHKEVIGELTRTKRALEATYDDLTTARYKYDRCMKEATRLRAQQRSREPINTDDSGKVITNVIRDNMPDAVRDDLATAPEGAKAAGGTIHTPPWRRTRAYRVRQHPRYNMWEGTPRAPNNGLPQLVAPTLDELLAVISEALSV